MRELRSVDMAPFILAARSYPFSFNPNMLEGEVEAHEVSLILDGWIRAVRPVTEDENEIACELLSRYLTVQGFPEREHSDRGEEVMRFFREQRERGFQGMRSVMKRLIDGEVAVKEQLVRERFEAIKKDAVSVGLASPEDEEFLRDLAEGAAADEMSQNMLPDSEQLDCARIIGLAIRRAELTVDGYDRLTGQLPAFDL